MVLYRYSNNNNNNVHYNRYNSLNQYYSSVDPYVSSAWKSPSPELKKCEHTGAICERE